MFTFILVLLLQCRKLFTNSSKLHPSKQGLLLFKFPQRHFNYLFVPVMNLFKVNKNKMSIKYCGVCLCVGVCQEFNVSRTCMWWCFCYQLLCSHTDTPDRVLLPHKTDTELSAGYSSTNTMTGKAVLLGLLLICLAAGKKMKKKINK